MRHGLHLLGKNPHQLAGAVLDVLIAEIQESAATSFGSESADERVGEATAFGMQLSSIGGSTSAKRSPDDVKAILAIMAPGQVSEKEAMRERSPDLFGSPGDAGTMLAGMLRHENGRPAILANAGYGGVTTLETAVNRLMRAFALAADLTSGRSENEPPCHCLLSWVAPISAPEMVGLMQRSVQEQASLRAPDFHSIASRLASGLVKPAAAGPCRDWATGRVIAGFEAFVTLCMPRRRDSNGG